MFRQESGTSNASADVRPHHSPLPDYAATLAAFHRTFANDLRKVIAALPLEGPIAVLDAACGDGFYLGLLADRLPSGSRLVGLDISRPFLELAQQVPGLQGPRCEVELRVGAVEDLVEGAPEFDLIWCAQSLFSLPEPVPALRHMAAALRPGGLVAVLENDTLHQVLLPWPTRLEIALRAAEYRSLADASAMPGKYYIGRRLPRVFAAAGLEPLGFRTQSLDRQAPLDDDLCFFLGQYLKKLAERVTPYLATALVEEFRRLIDPESPDYLLADPWFTMSWQNVLAWARRPAI